MSTALTSPAQMYTSSPLLVVETFEMASRLAKAMSQAKTLPRHLQNEPADCLRVVEFALRSGQSPFALADKTFFVGGKLAFEGQAIAAMVNGHPALETRLSYAYHGLGQAREVSVSAKLKGENLPREVTVSLAQGLRDSKGARSRWETDGDQMLAYYSARVWARRHLPDAILGIYTPEELRAGANGSGEIIDITPQAEEPHNSETGEVVEPEPPSQVPPTRAPHAAFWERTSLEIPMTDGNVGTWLPRMQKAVKAAPGQWILAKLVEDNSTHMAALKEWSEPAATRLQDLIKQAEDAAEAAPDDTREDVG